MTSRTGKVPAAASRVALAIKAARVSGKEPLPLTYLLERLETNISPLTLNSKRSENAALLDNHYHQVCWLIDHGHYTAALSLGRELFVTYFLLKAYPDADYKDKLKRAEAERWLGYYSRPMSSEPAGDMLPLDETEWTLLLKFYGVLSDRRNDVQHAGMRSQEFEYEKIVAICSELQNELGKLTFP
jgi:hypothetical protein